MKQKDIKVGKTYRNRKVGLTTRTVEDIYPFDEGVVAWRVSTTYVRYSQEGKGQDMHSPLKTFADWAGSQEDRPDRRDAEKLTSPTPPCNPPDPDPNQTPRAERDWAKEPLRSHREAS